MTSNKCFIPDAEKNNSWSIFLGADIRNRVCWGMIYLTKEKGMYYEEIFSSTYGGHPFGPSYSVCKNEVSESNASDDVRQIIEADQQGRLAELICHKNYIVFDSPYFDFGAFEYLRIPEVLLKRLNEMDPKVPEPPKKKSEEELLQEMVQQSKCVYTTLSIHPINPAEKYRTISTYYLSPTNTIIKANEYSGISNNGFYTSLSFSYESMSSEKLATEIAHTARVDEMTPHFTGKLIRVLESVNWGKNSIEMGFTRHAIMLAEGKYVLHRFQAQVATEGNGRPITYFSETVYPFTTENIDEITPKTFEKLRTEVAILQENYSEEGVLIAPLDDSWSQLVPIPQDFANGYADRYKDPIVEEHEEKPVSEQPPTEAKPVDTLEMLMEIVGKEDLSLLICYQENGTKGFVFDHLHQTGKTVLRKIDNIYWDVYYTTESDAYEGIIRNIPTQKEAIEQALLHAREMKKTQDKPDSKTSLRLLHWALDSAGILTLSGSGPMASVLVPQCGIHDWQIGTVWGDVLDEGSDETIMDVIPWDGRKVRKVVIESGLTSVSHKAFFSNFTLCVGGRFVDGEYDVLREIILPDTMEILESYSIYHCRALEKAVVPASVVNIHERNFKDIFSHCPNLVFYTPKNSYAASFAKTHGIGIHVELDKSIAKKSGQISPVPNSIEQLMKIVEKEGLSMLICYHEDQKQGFIFDYGVQPSKTVLRKFDDARWDVYRGVDTAPKEADIRNIDSSQKAYLKALEYARGSKTLLNESDNRSFLRWTLDENGILTLSGNGPMPSVTLPEYGVEWKDVFGHLVKKCTHPWPLRRVRKVVIKAGLTSISANAFSAGFQCEDGHFVYEKYDILQEIILPNTVKTLERHSVLHCKALTKVVIPDSVVNIHHENFITPFGACPDLVIYTTRGASAEMFAKLYGITVSIAPNMPKQRQNEYVDESKSKTEVRIIAERRANNLCPYCGRKLKGLFIKKCISCGKPKDY